ncbi:unnamed protein product [Meloidogyne enterolobii]|uniref:Uncharacterized protein n=1 Tax=Meloidogyne enterolobii TaxID=390850 RepID=A0ACB0YCN1_MELEN
MNLRRMSDCIVISPSDMIVIDYPDVQRITVHLHNNSDNILNQTGNQPNVSATAFPAFDGPSSSSLSSSPLGGAGTSTPSLLVRRQSGDCAIIKRYSNNDNGTSTTVSSSNTSSPSL